MAASDQSPCFEPQYNFGFDIAETLAMCPEPWQNFVREVNPTGHDDAAVDKVLARDYGGIMTYRKGPKVWKQYGWRTLQVRSKVPVVMFQEENMALWFKMRWS